MGIFCSCSAQKPGTTQDQDPTPGTAGHVSAGSDDFGNSWLSGVSASITTWISQPSSSFTTIWGKNVPESSQFSDATGSGDGTLANGQNSTDTSVRVFTLAQLRAATYNFRSAMLLGKGGFGKVYKGCLKEKLPPSGIKKTFIAVKQLDASSMQGLKEWKVYRFPRPLLEE
ncbi:KINASE CX32 putative-RELATED [Salix purpurea]|uniref:KINASE CX32 putative-RELATED n=1 Tax=Salix purpurea TaxID=77065 RepID=A0A9Q0ULA9_SALPP|nr:KINASE CX32 putative-RELATED [Salix purpurea]